MNKDERLTAFWRENKNKIGHRTTLNEFLQFCHEWDAICEKLRKAAGRE